MNVHPTTTVTTYLMSSVESTAKSCSQEPMSSVERKAMSCSRGEMSSTTRTTTKQKNSSAYPPCAKRHRAVNYHHESDSKGDTEEADDTPLTKADIPTIINVVLSNISTEGTNLRDDSRDTSHLCE